jgi:hypothetical protein
MASFGVCPHCVESIVRDPFRQKKIQKSMAWRVRIVKVEETRIVPRRRVVPPMAEVSL